MTATEAEKTAKYFGISIEQAEQMILKSRKMSESTTAKGIALAESVKNGKTLIGGVGA